MNDFLKPFRDSFTFYCKYEYPRLFVLGAKSTTEL